MDAPQVVAIQVVQAVPLEAGAPGDGRSRGGVDGVGRSTPIFRAAMVEACTAALGVGSECSANPPAARVTAASVSVAWQDGDHARVDVRDHREGPPWGVRDIAFRTSDAPLERWRAVGYAAGTLAAEFLTDKAETENRAAQTAANAAVAPAADASAASTVAPTVPIEAPATNAAPSAVHDHPSVNERLGGEAKANDTPSSRSGRAVSERVRVPTTFVDAAALLGPAFSDGGERLGAMARVGSIFGSALATASAAYAVHPEDARRLSARFLSVSAGGGYATSFGRFVATLRGELVVERLAARAVDASGRSGEAARWIGGVRAGGDVAYMVTDAFGFVLAADGTVRAAATDLAVDGRVVASVPRLDYSAAFGVRVAFF